MNRIPAGHEIVNSAELATLRRKARAHDAYLWATKRMADKARKRAQDNTIHGYNQEGYRAALTDFATLVQQAPTE